MKSVEESLLHMAKQSGKADENVVRICHCVCLYICESVSVHVGSMCVSTRLCISVCVSVCVCFSKENHLLVFTHVYPCVVSLHVCLLNMLMCAYAQAFHQFIPQTNLADVDMEDDMKHIVSDEIRRFRQSYKVSPLNLMHNNLLH